MQYVVSCRESYLVCFATQSVVARKQFTAKNILLLLFSSQRQLQLDSIEEAPLKMPKRRVEVDPRERKAALKLAHAPNVLSASEAMLAVKFSMEEAKNFTVQQWIWQ